MKQFSIPNGKKWFLERQGPRSLKKVSSMQPNHNRSSGTVRCGWPNV